MRRIKTVLDNFLGFAQRTKPRPHEPPSTDVLEGYFRSAPSPQNALDIFRGEWSSRLPEPLANLNAGGIDLFDDPRIQWFVTEIGGVSGKSILELGPLEGGHTYMLEKYGAADITSIEANSHAFLKCLIIKELLALKRARFLCGDFVEYLRQSGPTFEICLASGVLYHMQNPIELIALIAERCTGYLLMWSHYYDREIITSSATLAPKFTEVKGSEYGSFQHTLYRQEYQQALSWFGFCGGSAPVSYWMTRDEILNGLRHFGFQVLGVNFDDPHHPNGPAFALIAKRQAGG